MTLGAREIFLANLLPPANPYLPKIAITYLKSVSQPLCRFCWPNQGLLGCYRVHLSAVHTMYFGRDLSVPILPVPKIVENILNAGYECFLLHRICLTARARTGV